MLNRFFRGASCLSRLGSILMAGLIILTLYLCPDLFTGVQPARADSTSSEGQGSDAEIAKELY